MKMTLSARNSFLFLISCLSTLCLFCTEAKALPGDASGAGIARQESVVDLPAQTAEQPGRHLLERAGDLLENGRYPEAADLLEQIRKTARQTRDPALEAATLGSLGQLYHYTGRFDQAGQTLKQALDLAVKTDAPPVTVALIHNSLGNLRLSKGRFVDALASYEKSLALLADNEATLSTIAGIRINAAKALIGRGDSASTRVMLEKTRQALHREAENRIKARHLLALGITADEANHAFPGEAGRFRLLAYEALSRARELSASLDDRPMVSSALGYLGHLYEDEQRYESALTYTRRAILAGQQTEKIYLWQWQAGRCLRAAGDIDGAIGAYRRAVSTLQNIREDMTAGCKGLGSASFRQTAGPVYFELADLLLQRSGSAGEDESDRQADMALARDVVEQLKTVELQDYFQDDCVTYLRSKQTSLDALKGRTAAIYPVILADRLELLVSLPGGLKQITMPVDRETLTAEVRLLRHSLERPKSPYLDYAIRLYDWLVRPLETVLADRGIDTLIFVPDGPLRTIPMAALFDGNDFLLQKYAVVTVPGLTLTDPRPLPRENLRVLLLGLTEAVQGFSGLPKVADELAAIDRLFPATVVEDSDFTRERMARELKQYPYPIVHIASHGQFDRDPARTFLLTYDEKLTMDGLENVLELSKYREEPLELLTLSACQTAVGDERAALGLGGVSLKAGARSAVATLWFIDDEATSLVMRAFYEKLKNAELSKAKALQQAMLELREEERFRHPAYWAPFLLIGNWL